MGKRYMRQIELEKFGKAGQRNLESSHILLIGAGGVASSILPLLVAAGVGKISIFDADKVSTGNLHRQTIFRECDVGKPKAKAAKANLKKLNSKLEIAACEQFFGEDQTSIKALKSADLCIDASDSFKSRMAVSKLCKEFKVPEILAAAQGYVSQVTVLAGDFYLDSILQDKGASAERAKKLPIFPPSAHLSGVMAAGYALKKIAAAEPFEAGLFMSFDFERLKFFELNLGA